MGARINFCFKTEENNDTLIYLYSHWGADTWRQDLALALDKARPRWEDKDYCLRIIIDQLTKYERDKETGYGIGIVQQNEIETMDYPVLINVLSQTLNDEGREHSWQAFVEYQEEMKEYHA
jgi:hypothetical protein